MRPRTILSVLTLANGAVALGQVPTIIFEEGTTNSLALKVADKSTPVQILVDQLDWKGVIRAATDLAIDFGRVTGVNGTLISNNSNNTVQNTGIIIAGTIGRSNLIDQLVTAGKIDVKSVEGKWESFLTKVVPDPLPNIRSALVIAGSDKRGTIYGLYDISEQIGVSPWYYWADVPPQRHDSIYALNKTTVRESPSVKYRGIFLNDEAPSLTGWVNANFPRGKYGPGYNADFYSRVFELLLRLRANLLWPAMWDSMFAVDDPKSQALADEYGIVMGTSHTEPFARSTKEWNVLGKGPWKWNTNKDRVKSFMIEGARRAKPYETVYTIGMRGSHDTPMSDDIETELLQSIVTEQRQILSDLNMTGVPQSWCLYSEVQGYYEAGMKIPDDVVLLWADDNWGNIRRLPNAKDNQRKGGAGVYYHFDFVGPPRDYKWINTIILQKTWHQMQLAYAKNAREIWVVNVGDLKPLEIPINHFMDLAYDISRWNQDPLQWLNAWANRDFGHLYAPEIANIVAEYSNLAGQRKFEVTDPDTWSILHYDEADQILAVWEKLGEKAQAAYNKLEAILRPTFFETILHPVLAGGTFHRTMILAGKNKLHARQGRNYANWLADEVRKAFSVDHQLTKQFHELLNGKWKHMMDQTHFGYTYWQQPMRQMTPPLSYVQTMELGINGSMRVMAEGSEASMPGDDQANTEEIILPEISPYSQPRWLEIFSLAITDVPFSIEAEPFVKLSQRSGILKVGGEGSSVKIWVEIDWTLLKFKSGSTQIVLPGTADERGDSVSVQLRYTNERTPAGFHGFVEGSGYVSVTPWKLPEFQQLTSVGHRTEENRTIQSSPFGSTNTLSYISIPHYGVSLQPAVAATRITAQSAPIITIPFFSFSANSSSSVTMYFAPSLNTDADIPMAYTVAIDSAASQTNEVVKDRMQGKFPWNWDEAVIKERWESSTKLTIAPGQHTLKIQLLDAGLVLKKVIIDFGGLKKTGLGPPESVWVG